MGMITVTTPLIVFLCLLVVAATVAGGLRLVRRNDSHKKHRNWRRLFARIPSCRKKPVYRPSLTFTFKPSDFANPVDTAGTAALDETGSVVVDERKNDAAIIAASSSSGSADPLYNRMVRGLSTLIDFENLRRFQKKDRSESCLSTDSHGVFHIIWGQHACFSHEKCLKLTNNEREGREKLSSRAWTAIA